MKITDAPKEDVIKIKTKADSPNIKASGYKWWNANSKKDLADQLIATAAFLKEQQQFRYRYAAIFAKLYGNLPLFNSAGTNMTRMAGGPGNLPTDRPTMNVVQSCVDTLISRLTQNKPRPIFLTDNGDYKQRKVAKELNNFIAGELYQTKAYDLGAQALKDSAAAFGTGCLKVYEDVNNKRVAIDRVLATELLVDPNDGLYGAPRQLMQLKLIDRGVLMSMFPDYRAGIARAEQSFPDNGADAQRTVADQVMVVEGWHLPSGKNTDDGLHTIACSEGVIFEEVYTKEKFPFAFIDYNPRLLGFWGQSLAEQLYGTQFEINRLLTTISRSINLVGVPRVFIETGSKVSKAQFNDEIGSIIPYTGTKPTFEVAPCMPEEVYAQLQRLIEYAYQQSGISGLAAVSQKPAGIDSGEALRTFDNIQSDRFAELNKRYDSMYIDLAYIITDVATDIAERDGKYQTVYPGKDGVHEIDLPASALLNNPFVIQCYDSSSLPRDPAGRKQYVTEMMQAGILSLREGRRLLQFPDLEQEDKLANAAEERILSVLDGIVENGKPGLVDEFMDLQLALQLSVEYYNLYEPAKLEEKRLLMIKDFNAQVQDEITMSQPQMPPMMPGGGQPMALPEGRPTSQMLPVSQPQS